MATQQQFDELVKMLANRASRPQALAEFGPKLDENGHITLDMQVRSGMNTVSNQESMRTAVANAVEKLEISSAEISVEFSDYVAKKPLHFGK